MVTRGVLQVLPGTEQGDAHVPAGIREVLGGDKAVTAIVAGSAPHRYAPRRPAQHDLLRHTTTGVLHQRRHRSSSDDRQSIRLAHLARIEQCSREVHQNCKPTPRGTSPYSSCRKARLIAGEGCNSISAFTFTEAAKLNELRL
jgi:hypothetical protein